MLDELFNEISKVKSIDQNIDNIKSINVFNETS
jgi:hypothetical protein